MIKNNVISIKDSIEYKRNKKHTYFIDFIDWKNYTLVVEAESEQAAIETATQRCLNEDLKDVAPTKRLFEIIKIQTNSEEEEDD